jgi:thioredoxin-related protein
VKKAPNMPIAILAFLFLFTASSFAQDKTSLPAYQRYPTVPGLQLVTLDSTSYTKENLPKKKEVLIMLFSPDCEHCQHEAEEIVTNKEAFTATHILMVSTYPLARLKEFSEKYGLDTMENITVTKDPYYLLISFYEMRMFPYLALYNKKGNLLQTFQGNVAIERVIEAFKEAR